MPSVPHVPAPWSVHSLSGSVPSMLGSHVPLAPPVFAPTTGSQRPMHGTLQHTPSAQEPLAQWRLDTQTSPSAQPAQFGPPQSMSVSPLFWMLSLQLPPQMEQTGPPQSTPVSLPSCTPSKQVHCPAP